jgi:hypothetical protein
MTVLPFPSAELRPRFVPRPPRPRHIEVRIAAADGRAPYCRSRVFRLHERDLAELVAIAMRLESRA